MPPIYRRTIFALILVLGSLLGLVFAQPLKTYDVFTETRLFLRQVSEAYTPRGLQQYIRRECDPRREDCTCVLLVHGLGDQALTWSKILSPAGNKTPLAHWVAVSLPGSGRSPLLTRSEDYRVTNLAKILLDDVLNENCAEWVVVGNSFGGWIAAHMALLEPKRIAGLLLENSAGLNRDYSHLAPAFFNPSADRLREFQSRAYAQPMALPNFVMDSVAQRMRRMPVVDMINAQTPEDFLDSRLPELRMPVEILWGLNDNVLPLSHADYFHRQIPRSALHLARHCGHLPHKECPDEFWQAYARLTYRLETIKNSQR